MTQTLAFIRLGRPLFLYGGFAGVALGAALARWTGHPLGVATYAWVQALVTAFQLMVHYANDYFDRECDANARRTAFSGGSGVLLAGEIAPRTALAAALLCAACGFALCARFALTGDAVTAATGSAIGILAWCYSAPPVRLSARGLGEIDTALVVAVLVPCAAYAAFTGRIDQTVVTAALGPAAAMFAMMLSVELPDGATDLLAGKRNLVVLWGPAPAWRGIAIAAVFAVALAVATLLKARAGAPAFALLPAAAAAVQLARLTNGDPRPASIAFWGVALYATTVSGLAVGYALLSPR